MAKQSTAVHQHRTRYVVAMLAVLTTTIAMLGGPSTAALLGGIGAAQSTEPAERIDPPRSVRITAGGDILTESQVRVAAAEAGAASGARFDFGPLFAPLQPVISQADLAICHMELPIGRPGASSGNIGRSPFGGNLLISPFELAAGARSAGFDRCSTASNHSYDAGASGVVSTLDALDASGISHTGTARSENEALPNVFDVDGVRVGHVSYTRSSNTVLPSRSWVQSTATSSAQVIRDVQALRAGGAEIVIVSVHVTFEMQRAPIARDRLFANAITAGADIDMVVHHGPHVIQPLEMVNDTPVFWSTGNMISGMGLAISGRYADQRTLDGLLATVLFHEDDDGEWTSFPGAVTICTDVITRVVRPARDAFASGISARERSALLACRQRTEAVFGPTG
ncbi:MAG: CapA family protein [Ilumatobacter sp.]